jgi:membrane-associated phospholipid phosphatase
MPIYGLSLAMYVPSEPNITRYFESLYYFPSQAKEAVLYMFTVFGAVAPGLSFYILRKRNVISTIDMEDQRERNIPMYIMLSYCLLLYVLFRYKFPDAQLPKFIYALPLAGVFVTISFTFINRWIKISLHGGGAGILTGFLFAYALDQLYFQFWVLIFAVIVSGLTIAARLYLHKHTPREVYTGWSLALIITFVVNFLYPVIY